jgi:hypothetical protein
MRVLDRAKAVAYIYDVVFRKTIAKGIPSALRLYPDEVMENITGAKIHKESAELLFTSKGGILFNVKDVDTDTLEHIADKFRFYFDYLERPI